MTEPIPVVLSIAAWLATYAIHSTILLLGAWLLARRLPDRPDITSPLWKLAAVGGIVTASFSTAFGVHPLAGRVEVPRVAVVPAATPPLPEVVVPRMPIAPPDPGAAPTIELEGVLHVRPVARPHDLDNAGGATATVAVGPSRAFGWGWPQWLTAGWSVGALLGLVSLLAARLRLAAVLRSRRPAPSTLARQLAELCADVPIRGIPRLFSSDAIAVPFAAGVLAPAIVVPTRAVTLSPAAQRTMLAHELAHVIRRDPAWRLVLLALERVLFFQPLLRLARRRIEHDAEYLCDAWAAQRTAAPFELARCLTEIAGWVHPRRPLALAPSMAEPRSILRRRVLRLVAGEPVAGAARHRAMPVAWALCGLMPFVAPMVAWAEAPSGVLPSIGRASAPVEAGDPPTAVVGSRASVARVPNLVAAPTIAAAPPSLPRERPASRRAARSSDRERRSPRRDDRSPMPTELADVLDLPVPVVAELVYVDDAIVAELDPAEMIAGDAIALETELEVELDAIIAEADALAEAARANARLRDVATAQRIEARARTLRRRADAQRSAARTLGGRLRVIDSARADGRFPAPPPPPLAPLPPAIGVFDIVPATAPVAPTAP